MEPGALSTPAAGMFSAFAAPASARPTASARLPRRKSSPVALRFVFDMTRSCRSVDTHALPDGRARLRGRRDRRAGGKVEWSPGAGMVRLRVPARQWTLGLSRLGAAPDRVLGDDGPIDRGGLIQRRTREGGGPATFKEGKPPGPRLRGDTAASPGWSARPMPGRWHRARPRARKRAGSRPLA